MKRVPVLLFVCIFACSIALAHKPGEDMTSIVLGKGKITIHYGTPTLGARSLDEMIKPGVVWVMGMNNATTIETTVALNFGGKTLAPGKYSIFARPDEKKNWTLLVSTGTALRLDPSTVILETPLHFMKETESKDLLKMTLAKEGAGASLTVAWGTYRLHASFKAAA